MKKSLQISKLDAAKRQLETAIRLYFHNGDPVSIHTLTAAAHNVIHDIGRKRGDSITFLKDMMLERVKPGYEKELISKLNAAENFFKHADRDHDAMLDFNPDQSEMLILVACSNYCKMTGEYPPLYQIFNGWFMVNHPNLFNFPEDIMRIIGMSAQEIIDLGRHRYFDLMLPLVMKIST